VSQRLGLDRESLTHTEAAHPTADPRAGRAQSRKSRPSAYPIRKNSTLVTSLLEILSQPPACHRQPEDPEGARAARTLLRTGDSDWTGSRLHHQGSTPRARADQDIQAKCETSRESGSTVSDSFHHLRSSANPRPATARTRRGTRCTDSLAGQRPGLDRELATLHRSCTPRARLELRRSRPLEHATRAAPEPLKRQETRIRHSEYGPHPRDQTTRPAGYHWTPDPQDGPRDKKPRQTRRELPPGGRPSTRCTWARFSGDSDQTTRAISMIKNRAFYGNRATAHNAHELSPASCNILGLDRRKHLWSSRDTQALP
jgi:hypothetical protein